MGKIKLGFATIFLLSMGCGGEYTLHSDPVNVNVNAKVDFTFTELMEGFKVQCRREHPEYTQSEVNSCASVKFSTLISDIDSSIN
jgi:hypothetical protein